MQVFLPISQDGQDRFELKPSHVLCSMCACLQLGVAQHLAELAERRAILHVHEPLIPQAGCHPREPRVERNLQHTHERPVQDIDWPASPALLRGEPLSRAAQRLPTRKCAARGRHKWARGDQSACCMRDQHVCLSSSPLPAAWR